MLKQLPILLVLAAVLLGPIFLRSRTEQKSTGAAEDLVIITPHDQAIREEFTSAFAKSHLARTGKSIHIDWRTPGGTSDAVRYLNSEFVGSFQNYWENTLHRGWNGMVAGNFDNPQAQLSASAATDSPAQQARRAFLESRVGCGIDLFFGGGAFDFAKQAAAGHLVDCGYISAHPEIFNEKVLPEKFSGEKMWDSEGRWIGVCLSAFGICYNTDSLQRLGIERPPGRWADLGDPRYFHEIALANPTQSGSVNRTFELLIQQQILEEVNAAAGKSGGKLEAQAEKAAIHAGWERAMRLLMKIGANARYFTDSSSKIALDVAGGEAAAGMSIDFYGRFESESVRRPDGSSRLQFTNAIGGTSFSADTIGLLRGAPHAELAREFIAWVMSPEGQQLWNWKVGAPNGPEHYSLRRLPILPATYAPELREYRADPDVNPYSPENTFVYHGAWTGPLFDTIAYVVRVMCIDPHDELAEAWQALIRSHFPPRATEVFSTVDVVSYEEASETIRKTLNPSQPGEIERAKISQVRLAKDLADHFREQYRHAADLARRGE